MGCGGARSRSSSSSCRTGRATAQRTADVGGPDFDLVAELGEPAQRGVQRVGSLSRRVGQIRPGDVPDQQGVAGQHQPGLRPATNPERTRGAPGDGRGWPGRGSATGRPRSRRPGRRSGSWPRDPPASAGTGRRRQALAPRHVVGVIVGFKHLRDPQSSSRATRGSRRCPSSGRRPPPRRHRRAHRTHNRGRDREPDEEQGRSFVETAATASKSTPGRTLSIQSRSCSGCPAGARASPSPPVPAAARALTSEFRAASTSYSSAPRDGRTPRCGGGAPGDRRDTSSSVSASGRSYGGGSSGGGRAGSANGGSANGGSAGAGGGTAAPGSSRESS